MRSSAGFMFHPMRARCFMGMFRPDHATMRRLERLSTDNETMRRLGCQSGYKMLKLNKIENMLVIRPLNTKRCYQLKCNNCGNTEEAWLMPCCLGCRCVL